MRQGFNPRYCGPGSGEWVSRSVLFCATFRRNRFSALPSVLLCSPTKCLTVSRAHWASRDLGGSFLRETQLLAVRDDHVADGLVAADLARRVRLPATAVSASGNHAGFV